MPPPPPTPPNPRHVSFVHRRQPWYVIFFASFIPTLISFAVTAALCFAFYLPADRAGRIPFVRTADCVEAHSDVERAIPAFVYTPGGRIIIHEMMHLLLANLGGSYIANALAAHTKQKIHPLTTFYTILVSVQAGAGAWALVKMPHISPFIPSYQYERPFIISSAALATAVHVAHSSLIRFAKSPSLGPVLFHCACTGLAYAILCCDEGISLTLGMILGIVGWPGLLIWNSILTSFNIYRTKHDTEYIPSCYAIPAFDLSGLLMLIGLVIADVIIIAIAISWIERKTQVDYYMKYFNKIVGYLI